MILSRRRQLAAIAAMGLTLTAWPAWSADEWPLARSINWVVPYPPGGTTDILGRAIAQRLAKTLGTPVIVDNKAGATGTIGSAYVAKAAPDGYTLLGTSIGPQAIVPNLFPSLPYDPVKAFDPVSLIGTIPHVLVTAAASPLRTPADLVAQAKAQPQSVSYASGGNGTILHMQGELLGLQTGARMTHVPYKGDTPAIQDVLAGHTHFMFAPVAAALPHVRSGRLRALAVTSAQPLPALPGVPTMAQAGFKDFVVEQWQAVYLPAGTPEGVVTRLNQDILRILKEPDIVAMADKLGVTLVGSSPRQLAQTQRADLGKWGQVIKEAGIKPD